MTEINSLKDLYNSAILSSKLTPKFENLTINIDIELPFDNSKTNYNFTSHYAKNKIEFSNCNFKKKLLFLQWNTNNDNLLKPRAKNNVDYYFFDCEINEFDTTNVTFEKKVRFHKCDFIKKTRFNNTTFEGLVDFWNSTFHERIIYYKVNFNDVVVLSSTIFKKNVLFTYSTIKDTLILRGATFLKGLDLSLAIIKGDLIIFDLTLNDFESIKEPKKNDTEWLKTYDGITSEIGDIFNSNKRETFRIIKNQLINQKNIIDSNNFSFLESKTLAQEEWLKIIKPESCKSFRTSFSNGAMLLFNRISNRHRTSYVNGILFTMIFALIFYYFTMISTSKYCFSFSIDWEIITNNVSGYFNFLMPTHKYNFLGENFLKEYVNNNTNKWFYVFDTLGRIFVGYGIYQTIQGFRKYRK